MPLWNAYWETLMPAARRPASIGAGTHDTSQEAPHSTPVPGDEAPEWRKTLGLVGSGGLGTATGAAAVAPACPVCRVNTRVLK